MNRRHMIFCPEHSKSKEELNKISSLRKQLLFCSSAKANERGSHHYHDSRRLPVTNTDATH